MTIQTTSADPKVTLGPAKAVAAFVATIVLAFLGALGTAITDQVITPGEWIAIGIATILATGLVGGATYATPAKVTVHTAPTEPDPAGLLDEYRGTGK